MIASDNTLGSFSGAQGRLYVAVVDRDLTFRLGGPGLPRTRPTTPTSSCSRSDNGGASWTRRGIVNDDNSLVDGFSEAGFLNGAPYAGRPQFSPSLAVDQATGTLVASWFDTRHDAARARVSTYLTTSTDGGVSFGGQTFVNQAEPGDQPGDEPVGEPRADPRQPVGGQPEPRGGDRRLRRPPGAGRRRGRVYAAWSSNLNAGIFGDGTALLDIRVARATIAAGPRILNGTMGPVGGPGDTLNGQRAADGGPLARALVVEFDRRVDPATFTAADVQFLARDVNGVPLPAARQPVATNVTPLDNNALGATQFRVDFRPADGSADSTPGTISYVVGPDIQDRIPRDTGGRHDHPQRAAGRVRRQAPQVPLPLPDLTTVTSSLVVSGFNPADVVSKVTAQINLNHTFTSDLIITLISPQGRASPWPIASAAAARTSSARSSTTRRPRRSRGHGAVHRHLPAVEPAGRCSTASRSTAPGSSRSPTSPGPISAPQRLVDHPDPGHDHRDDDPARQRDGPGRQRDDPRATLDVFEAPGRLNPGSQALFAAPFVRDSLGLVIPGPARDRHEHPGHGGRRR